MNRLIRRSSSTRRLRPLLAIVAGGVCLLVCGIALQAAPVQGGGPAPAAQPAPASAANRAPAKIAVVDTQRVFKEMQETQEFKSKLEAEGQKLKAEETDRKAKIVKLREERDATYKPGSPDAERLNDQILKEGVELEIWGKYATAQAERNQKKLLKTLFQKIEEATKEYAQQQGIDIVLVKQNVDLPDNLEGITFDQLRAVINQRDILFASDRVDISSAVLAMVDAKFRAGGGVKVPLGRTDVVPDGGAADPLSGSAEKSDAAAPSPKK